MASLTAPAYGPAVHNSDETVQQSEGPVTDLRVGSPERELALVFLDEHFGYERLDQADYEQRRAACAAARTESELRRLFADLPAPHPDLFAEPPAAPADEEITALAWAVSILLVLGLPVAIVLGVVYGLWWTLVLPVVLGVLMVYIEHLVNPKPAGEAVVGKA